MYWEKNGQGSYKKEEGSHLVLETGDLLNKSWAKQMGLLKATDFKSPARKQFLLSEKVEFCGIVLKGV